MSPMKQEEAKRSMGTRSKRQQVDGWDRGWQPLEIE